MTACPICQFTFDAHATLGAQCPRCLLLGAGSDMPTVHGRPGLQDLDEVAEALPMYDILDTLGWGGMGVVYRARQRSTQRVVALKLIHRAVGLGAVWVRQRFSNEAQSAAKLDHPNVVPVYESGEADGQPYFTMKLVEGGNLATRRADFALPLQKDVARQRALAAWWAKVARAVHHVHERGVLHRDLKPSNILVDLAGEPHVTDFGLAGAVDDQMSQRLTLSGEVMGTPAYMAPEMATDGVKAATVRSDVYGLGIMLYELICGRLPFQGGTPLAIMQAVITQEVTHPSVLNFSVSRDLATITLCSIEREPLRRYASAVALADDLQRFCAGEPIHARAVGTLERAVKWMRRRPAIAALSALALIAVLGGGSFSAWQWWQAAQANAGLNRELRVSTAQRWAALAGKELDSSPTRALLVAAEAVEITRRVDGSVRPSAYAALLHTVAQVGGRQVLPPSPQRTCLAQSPDGRWLVAGMKDGSIEVVPLNMATVPAATKVPKTHQGPVRAIAWLPGGELFFTGGEDGQVLRWHPGELVGKPHAASRTEQIITALSVTQDGQWLAVGSGAKLADESLLTGDLAIHEVVKGEPVAVDERGLIQLHSLGEGTPRVIDLPLLFRNARDLQFTPDNRWLIALDQRRTHPLLARLDMVAGTAANVTLKDLPTPVHHAVISASGRWLATATTDRTVRLYDLSVLVEGAASAVSLGSYTGVPERLAFSPDEAQLSVIARHDDVLRVFAVGAAGAQSLDYDIGFHAGTQTAFSTDGVWLFATGGHRALTGISKGKNHLARLMLRGPEGDILHLQIAQRSKAQLILAGLSDGSAWCWLSDSGTDATSPRKVARVVRVRDARFAPEGFPLAVIDRDDLQLLTSGADGLLDCTDFTIPKLDPTQRLAFSPEGRWIAIASVNGVGRGTNVLLVSRADPRQIKHIAGPTKDDMVHALAFHPDGRLFCGVDGLETKHVDQAVIEWKIAADGQAHVLHRYPVAGQIKALAISPEGRWLAAGTTRLQEDDRNSSESRVILRDLHELDAARTWVPWSGDAKSGVEHVAFSADGHWLAIAGETPEVIVLDLHAADPFATAKRAPFGATSVQGIAFSPDSQTLLVVEEQGTASMWKFTAAQHTEVPLPAVHHIAKALFAPTGNQLYTIDDQGHVWLWDLDVGTLLRYARQQAGRELTAMERQRLGL